MAKFLRHAPCPSCGSRNNNAVYDDGSEHCFTPCGYFRRADNSVDRAARRIDPQRAASNGGVPPLPEDVSTYIPEEPYTWLKKYLTDEEILKHGLGWSSSTSLLIFPVRGPDGTLLMWQGRYFGPNNSYPKYVTKGKAKDVLHFLTNSAIPNSVVVTEDLISAIVVSRVCTAIPVFGAHLSNEFLLRVSKYYPNLLIWLDFNKTAVAIKTANLARILFDDVKVLLTEEDPKCYTKEKIGELLSAIAVQPTAV